MLSQLGYDYLMYNEQFLLKIQSISNKQMQSLGRLFGRDVANVAEHAQQNKHNLINRHNARSMSFCGDDHKPLQHKTIKEANISQKIQKPKFAMAPSQQKADLKVIFTDYFDESINFMLSEQAKCPLLTNYMNKQTQINESMRAILFDWIVDIHLKFKMSPQTLYIVAAIIDKYLSMKVVKKEQLQLIGAAAFFIGAKYEETYQVPAISELVNLSARLFTKNELLRMEAEIIKTLDFNLVFNTPYHFFEPFCKILNYEPKKFYLAQYTLELAILDAKFLKFKSSLLAASCIFLINKIKKAEIAWPDVLVAASGYQQKELRSCARELCQLLQFSESSTTIKCLKRKFGLPKYYEVSKIRLEKKDKSKN